MFVGSEFRALGREFGDSTGEFLMRHAVSCKEETLNPKL